jgi:hypothetical protein
MDADPLSVYSLVETFSARPQFLRGTEPVFFRRSLRTASGLPQRMSQHRNVLVTEGRNDTFILRSLKRPLFVLVSLLGVLKSSPRVFVPGLVVLFLMGFGSTPMSVGGNIVQFGSPLMVFVMRSAVITSRHLKTHYLP